MPLGIQARGVAPRLVKSLAAQVDDLRYVDPGLLKGCRKIRCRSLNNESAVGLCPHLWRRSSPTKRIKYGRESEHVGP